MLSVMALLSMCLRPPALAQSPQLAELIEDVIAASHRSEDAEGWQDRRLRWQAAAIPVRMIKSLAGRDMPPEQSTILIELQVSTLQRILREEPAGWNGLQPALARLRAFLDERRMPEHLEAAAVDLHRAYRRQYAAFRLAHRRDRMRRDFEEGRPWGSR